MRSLDQAASVEAVRTPSQLWGILMGLAKGCGMRMWGFLLGKWARGLTHSSGGSGAAA